MTDEQPSSASSWTDHPRLRLGRGGSGGEDKDCISGYQLVRIDTMLRTKGVFASTYNVKCEQDPCGYDEEDRSDDIGGFSGVTNVF